MSARVKTALHHWWPISLSEYWCDLDGGVSRLTPTQRISKTAHKNFGAETNAHNVKLAEDWQFSFEGQFDSVDSDVHWIVDQTLNLSTIMGAEGQDVASRMLFVKHSDDFYKKLLALIVSVHFRSPGHRAKIARRLGKLNPNVDNTLVQLNMIHGFPDLIDGIRSCGRILLMYTDCNEYIFGEGFYSNIYRGAQGVINPFLVLPLLPGVCAFFSAKSTMLGNERIVTIRATPQEVERINRITQAYTKDAIYFRSSEPTIVDAFNSDSYLELREMPRWLSQLATLMATKRSNN